jgi:hypothetical protein
LRIYRKFENFYRIFHKMEFKAFKGGSKAIALSPSKK